MTHADTALRYARLSRNALARGDAHSARLYARQAKRYANWSPYQGPHGGKGWQNESGDVVYGGDKPGTRGPAREQGPGRTAGAKRVFPEAESVQDIFDEDRVDLPARGGRQGGSRAMRSHRRQTKEALQMSARRSWEVNGGWRTEAAWRRRDST